MAAEAHSAEQRALWLVLFQLLDSKPGNMTDTRGTVATRRGVKTRPGGRLAEFVAFFDRLADLQTKRSTSSCHDIPCLPMVARLPRPL